MKYLSLLLVLLFVSCSTLKSGATGPEPVPMKKADVILIETADSSEECFKTIHKIFEDEGFGVHARDEKSFLLETDYMEHDDLKIWLFSEVVETDSSSVIELSGMVEVPEFQHRVEYGGAKPATKTRIHKKDSSYNPAWKIMMGIALKYQGGKLWYARESS